MPSKPSPKTPPKPPSKSPNPQPKEPPQVELSFQRRILLEWSAPERPFHRLNKQVFSTILSLAFLVGVILFFIEGTMPVITLIAIIFFFYILGTIPPRMITHRLTNWGVETEGHRWPWDIMTRYWIEGQENSRMIVIELIAGFPRHLRLLLGEQKEDKIKTLLEKYLIYDRPQANWLEKLETWLKTKINLAA
jgi:hypothetical protein